MNRLLYILLTFLFPSFLYGQAFQHVINDGGAGEDAGNDVFADGSGNFYTTGYYDASGIFGKTGSGSCGNHDIFVAKYNRSAELQWVDFAGGIDQDYGYGITGDNMGGIYVTGSFSGNAWFGGPDSIQSNGGSDLFIVKFDSAGQQVWMRQIGGKYDDSGFNLFAQDSNIIITGQITDSVFYNSDLLAIGGISGSVFSVSISRDGVIQWTHSALGSGNSYGLSVTGDPSGNLYFTGAFSDSFIIDSITIVSKGAYDGFIYALNSSGNFLWTKSFGGKAFESGNAVSWSKDNNFVLAASISDSCLFMGDLYSGKGITDLLTAKFSPEGNLIWKLTSGGAGQDQCMDLAVDDSSNIITANYCFSDVIYGSVNIKNMGGMDLLVSKLSSDGNIKWVIGTGGENNENLNAIAINKKGSIAVTGAFYKKSFLGSDSIFSKGENDVFFGILNDSLKTFYSATTRCPGDTILIDYNLFPFDASIELSSEDGNFYAPVDLPYSIVPFTSYYSVIIPKNLEYGTSYKIRIKRKSPVLIGREGPEFAIESYKIIKNNITLNCGDTVQANIFVVPSDNLIFNWTPSTGLSDSTILKPYVSGNQSMDYQLEVKSDAGCVFSETIQKKVVPPVYQISFTENKQFFAAPPFLVQFQNTSPQQEKYNYKWDFGDGSPIANAPSPEHLYSFNGYYTIKQIAEDKINGCSDTLVKEDWIICIGGPSSLEEYPELFQINSNQYLLRFPVNNLLISDISGKVVDAMISMGDKGTIINIKESLVPGIYFYSFEWKGRPFAGKLIKY